MKYQKDFFLSVVFSDIVRIVFLMSQNFQAISEQDVRNFFSLFTGENFRFTLRLLNLDRNSTRVVVNYKLKLKNLSVH